MAGLAWHTLNYICGLLELGHDVLFLEDIIHHGPPPGTAGTPTTTAACRFLERVLAQCGRPVMYSYFSKWDNRFYGADRADVNRFLKTADAMLCVTANARFPEDRLRPKRVVAIDTDPVFTQLRMLHHPEFLEYYLSYDFVATFGKLIGGSKCDLPTHGLSWIPTHQPVSLRQWPPLSPRKGNTFSTVTSWNHASGHFRFKGQNYRRAKDCEWLKMLDLPRRIPWNMEMAIDIADVRSNWEPGMPFTAAEVFRDRGWHLRNPCPRNFSAYHQFIAQCAGEFSVASDQYVRLLSGWFSDRSALFLATGKPVVTQETGFSEWLPTGDGLFSFTTVEEAASALNEIAHRYEYHAKAARRIAEEYFEAKKVISDLLERVL